MKVLLVGYGLAGRVFHEPLIRATPGLELAGIVRSRSAPVSFEGFDLAVIATPNTSHYALASAALAAGLRVVVDKPLAVTAAEARSLVAQAPGRLTVFQNRRWDGDFLTLRSLDFGTVYRYESRYERWRPALKPGWRETSEPGSGILYDLGSHVIDQAVVLFGRVASVYSERFVRRSGAVADDDVFLALHHAGGMVSHLWMSAVAAHLGPRFRVLGSAGAYVKYGVDAQEDHLKAGLRPGDAGYGVDPSSGRWYPEDREVPTLPGAYHEFYRAVAEGKTPVDPEDAVHVLEIIEAAQKGGWQPVTASPRSDVSRS